MAKLVKCKACGAEVSKKADKCPQCAEPMKKNIKLSHVLVLVIFSVVVYSMLFPEPKVAPPVERVPVTKEDVGKKTEELLAELKLLPVSQYSENLKRYQMLAKMHPKEGKYSEKVAFYQSKIARVKKIEEQFSAWSGEHVEFGRYIQERLKDPDSYKHVKTVYFDKGDHIIVDMTYRATNSFGAVTTGKAYAESSLDGTSLKIISAD